MPNIGFQELLVIALIALLVFGAKRLPEVGAAMGKSIREFKRSMKDMQNNIEASVEREELSSRTTGSQVSGRSSREPKKLSQ